jgi:hypothetical protein
MSGPPDPAVLALTAEPFASVGDAHRRLAALERTFRARGDRRGAFLAIYERVTGEVGRSIAAGEFADPDWVADYLVAFAERYRRALVAFEAAATGDCLVSQAALLGINAHVNYDLALALDAAGIDADREARDADREARDADHCAVNDVLKRLVDSWSRWGLRRRLATAFRTGSSTGLAHLVLGPTRSVGLRALFGRIERGPGRRVRRWREPDATTDGDGRDGTG